MNFMNISVEEEFKAAVAPRHERFTRARNIIKSVADKHRVTVAEIMGDSRARHVVAARHEAIYRVTSECGLGCAEAGRMFGRDHTTIIHAVRKGQHEPHR